VVQNYPYGVTRRTVCLFSISLQREPIICHWLAKPVLYVQQQTVQLVNGGRLDAHVASPHLCALDQVPWHGGFAAVLRLLYVSGWNGANGS
jgi:hypothetical protein